MSSNFDQRLSGNDMQFEEKIAHGAIFRRAIEEELIDPSVVPVPGSLRRPACLPPGRAIRDCILGRQIDALTLLGRDTFTVNGTRRE